MVCPIRISLSVTPGSYRGAAVATEHKLTMATSAATTRPVDGAPGPIMFPHLWCLRSTSSHELPGGRATIAPMGRARHLSCFGPLVRLADPLFPPPSFSVWEESMH